MARYFAVNSLAGCRRSHATVVENTTAGRFNSSWVGHAIHVPVGTLAEIDAADWGVASISGTFWFRLDYWGSAMNGGVPFLWLTPAGANAYRLLASPANNAQFQYWNSGTSAWVNWGSSFAMTSSVLHSLTLKLVMQTSFEIYLAGVLMASSAVVPTNSAASVRICRVASPSASGGQHGNFSQAMGADYDLRNSNFMNAALNGNSAVNTDGTGAYTEVGETILNEDTAVVLSASGNKRGQTKAAVSVPSGKTIKALVLNARGRVTAGDGKLGVRSGGANYTSVDLDYGSSYEPRGRLWEDDPATSVPFSAAGFNSAEVLEEAV